MSHFPFCYILPQFLQRPRSGIPIIRLRYDLSGGAGFVTGAAQRHEISWVISSSQNLRDYVIDGLFIFLGATAAVGAEVVGFRPDLLSPVLVGFHNTCPNRVKCVSIKRKQERTYVLPQDPIE